MSFRVNCASEVCFKGFLHELQNYIINMRIIYKSKQPTQASWYQSRACFCVTIHATCYDFVIVRQEICLYSSDIWIDTAYAHTTWKTLEIKLQISSWLFNRVISPVAHLHQWIPLYLALIWQIYLQFNWYVFPHKHKYSLVGVGADIVVMSNIHLPHEHFWSGRCLLEKAAEAFWEV